MLLSILTRLTLKITFRFESSARNSANNLGQPSFLLINPITNIPGN